MHGGGLEIMHMHGILRDVVTEFIGFTVAGAGLDAAACHPVGEAAWVMIAPISGGAGLALAVSGAAKFTAPDDERLV